jgi:hypothetical protein
MAEIVVRKLDASGGGALEHRMLWRCAISMFVVRRGDAKNASEVSGRSSHQRPWWFVLLNPLGTRQDGRLRAANASI